ncbi:hypothetical protein GWI33_000336, partial [Rhynchophorus ferrugineus]
CLLEKGEIAFLKHTTISDLLATREFSGIAPNQFELFCKDGTRRSLSDYESCNWGKVSSDTFVVSSAVPFDRREKFQRFLQKFADRYGRNGTGQFHDSQRKQEFDNFGNQIHPNQNHFDHTDNYLNNDPYTNRESDSYNQYQDRGSNRYKRQNYGYDQDQYNRNRYDDRYGNNQYSQDRYNDRYGQDPYNDPTDRNTHRQGSYQDQDRSGLFDQDRDSYYEYFSLFESSPRYGVRGNLLVTDSSVGIMPIPENLQTYQTFLADSHEVIMGVRRCPVERMTLCVTSDQEKDKCIKMKIALKAQLLKPELECYKGRSQIHCMQSIKAGTADVTVLDASDVYTAGLHFGLVPFISEVYNLEDADYYVVAVAKESDPDTELTYLRSKIPIKSWRFSLVLGG